MDRRYKIIQAVLFSLFCLDIALAVTGFFFPDFWYAIFHGAPYVDPQGLLRRCAANWAAFALFQGLALLKWRERPYWLVLVAGVRFSDILTDWAYLWFCSDVTLFGGIGLFCASPTNLVAGLYLLNSYRRIPTRVAS